MLEKWMNVKTKGPIKYLINFPHLKLILTDSAKKSKISMTRFVCFIFGKSLTLIAIYHLSFMKWKIFDSFFLQRRTGKVTDPSNFWTIFLWNLDRNERSMTVIEFLEGVWADRFVWETYWGFLEFLPLDLMGNKWRMNHIFEFVSLFLSHLSTLSFLSLLLSIFAWFLSLISLFAQFLSQFFSLNLRFSLNIVFLTKLTCHKNSKLCPNNEKTHKESSIVQLSIKFKFPINIFTSQKHNRSKTVSSIQIKKSVKI